jgi:hypothetical protein
MPRYPALYQINTRVRQTELAHALGRAATLDDFSDAELDRLAELGFDWIWLLGVWQTGPASQRVSLSEPAWRREFQQALPDLHDEDIGGSCFAIRSYTVHDGLGGDAALARLRERMRSRGLKLMLDFVPNHVALDHPWVDEQPDFFVQGSAAELANAPQNWCRLRTRAGSRVLAHGRDPYFDGWPDTLQLNYAKAQLQQAMIGELQRIAPVRRPALRHGDAGPAGGLRADLGPALPALLAQGDRRRAASKHPDFEFMAEVYWDLEWTLQQQGFDHTYDKRLYDRLRALHARRYASICAGLDYQDRLVRFLENHDEPRAASSLAHQPHAAAALISYTTPGLRFFHQGQLEGNRVHVSPHLVRAPQEPVDPALARLYARLLAALRHPALRDGSWSLLECTPAWPGNASDGQYIAWCWQDAGERWLCAAVNYAAQPGQCFVRLPMPRLAGRTLRFKDLLGPAEYERAGDDLLQRGLYLDLPPWGHHLFEVEG